jgi:hypothetical protein
MELSLEQEIALRQQGMIIPCHSCGLYHINEAWGWSWKEIKLFISSDGKHHEA